MIIGEWRMVIGEWEMRIVWQTRLTFQDVDFPILQSLPTIHQQLFTRIPH